MVHAISRHRAGVLVVILILCSGCRSSPPVDERAAELEKAFHHWVRLVSERDYWAMWMALPQSSRDAFADGWDAEREALERAPLEQRERFLQVYGFASMEELRLEEAPEFFVRSMRKYPQDGTPMKYELLKRASVDEIVYGEGGRTADLTFVDQDGSPLPLRMRMIREGDEWKVVRLP